MQLTSKAPLALAATLALAAATLTPSANAQQLALDKRGDQTPSKTVPSRQGTGGLSAGGGNAVPKKDIWGSPDDFLAKCNEAGGGASTDQDGFPHCEDANGGNIPIPMEE